MPSKVFISYRREDSQYQAGRIYEAFVRALPPGTVFMDVNSMAPGEDFVEALEGWVQQCDVLLALIGPTWLNLIDPRTNLRRLDNLEDFVRIEVRGALARKIPVVPVLLDAAKMPTAVELPDDIKALTRRNAEFVDFRTFDVDVQRLIKGLKIGSKIEQIARNPEPPAGDNGDRKAAVPGPDVPAVTSEPDRLNAASLRVWPAVAVALAVIVAFLLAARVIELRQLNVQDGRASAASDALKASEGARQEAEARLAAALAAQDKAEQASKVAEKRANDTADELKKSEKARSDVEDRATGAAAAQAKAEERQRTAEKARAAAEGAASGAAIARTQADSGRQAAEARANEAAEALKKSEKARQEAEASASAATTARIQAETGRQDAETRLKQATDTWAKSEQARKNSEVVKVDPQVKGQEPKKPLSLSDLATLLKDKDTPPKRRVLLSDIGNNSRWTLYGSATCGKPDYSLATDRDAITWTGGSGNVDVEGIVSSAENEFRTMTRKSQTSRGETYNKVGTTWTYSRDGDAMRVRSSLGHSFTLTRCP